MIGGVAPRFCADLSFRMSRAFQEGDQYDYRRVARSSQNAAAAFTEMLWTEKSPGRGLRHRARLDAALVVNHGWQFACNVATGGKACGITSA